MALSQWTSIGPRSPNGRVVFTPPELHAVLGHYELGRIESAHPIEIGSPDAPKALITCSRGRFVLKRKAPRDNDTSKAALAHAVQLQLERCGLPVARLVGTRRSNSSMVVHNGTIYELSVYIDARFYSASVIQAGVGGAMLARLHAALHGFDPDIGPIARMPKMDTRIEQGLKFWRANPTLVNHTGVIRGLVAELDELIDSDNEPTEPTLLHGDYHPGNLLFYDNSIAAVFDFDGVHYGRVWDELAQACAQFAMRSRDEAADLDLATTLAAAYNDATGVPLPPADEFAPRMARDMLAELVTRPIPELIKPVLDRVRWLIAHRDAIPAL